MKNFTATPKEGEWWMCQSLQTLRKAPMIKVKEGWASICNSEGKPLHNFVQPEPVLEPLYRMVAG